MLNGIEVLCHSSIRIDKHLIMYIDPYKIKDETHDADIIFCTHDHTDHFSEEDILKVKNENTIFVGTEDILIKVMKLTLTMEFVSKYVVKNILENCIRTKNQKNK